METKHITARICVICEERWPDEWPGKYTGKMEDFRDWLNQKTGLNVCHITNKEAALKAWLEALEAQN
jgi:hypothetical protein